MVKYTMYQKRKQLPNPKPKKKMNTGSSLIGPVAKNAALGLAGTGISAVTGLPPATSQLAVRAASMAIRAASRALTKAQPKKSTVDKWAGASTGVYQGVLKKPTKIKPTIESVCLEKGFHSTEETFGRIQDEHTVYIAHSTYNVQLMAKTIQGAILRSLFKKAGYAVPNMHQIMPLYSYGDADGFKVEYITKQPMDGTTTTYNYISTSGQTFSSYISAFTQMYDHIRDYLAGLNTQEPSEVSLYLSDRNGVSTNWRLCSNINLKNQILFLHIGSSLKIQNRTAGDKASATDEERYSADRIDSQPLKGRIYQFKHADMRIKKASDLAWVGENQFNRAASKGLQLVRGSVDTIDWYQELPSPSLWANCDKTAGLVINPGNFS